MGTYKNEQRNTGLFRLFLDGLEMKELATKYGISVARVKQILSTKSLNLIKSSRTWAKRVLICSEAEFGK